MTTDQPRLTKAQRGAKCEISVYHGLGEIRACGRKATHYSQSKDIHCYTFHAGHVYKAKPKTQG